MNKQAYMESLLNRLQLRVAEDEYPLLQKFAELFWSRTPEEDLADRDTSDAAGITVSCWQRLRDHSGDEVSILLSNPARARDGWESGHTVVLVTAPNMPFMVDSVLMALSHDGLVTHLLNNIVVGVDRDEEGLIVDLSAELDHPNRELLIYAEIDQLEDADLPPLYKRLETMAVELQAAVADYEPMKNAVSTVLEDLRNTPPPLPAEEIEEGIAFLEWMLNNHFTFLGYREFEYHNGAIRQTEPAYGIQRVRSAASERNIDDQPQDTRDFLLAPTLLTFSKSGTKSLVHRPAYPDYVGVKRFGPDGNVLGEIGFIGLYTSRVYKELPENIPHVRRKVRSVIERSGLDPNGFDGKVLAEVLATYPRDELVQIEEQELFENSMIITDIHERRRVRVFPRYDAYGLFVNVLVFLPRDLFNTQVRIRLHELLVETFDAEDADYDAHLSESILVRLQYNLRIGHGSRPYVDRIELEQEIAQLIGDWVADLNAALLDKFGANRGKRLRKEYAEAFNAGYREEFSVAMAVDDVEAIEELNEQMPLATRFCRQPEDPDSTLRLKIYHLGDPLPLSDVVPKLENMGLRIITEHPYFVERATTPLVSVHNFDLHFDGDIDLDAVSQDFNQGFVGAWHGEIEDDSYNRLILTAGLSARQVSILRAYAQYMKQIRFGFSQAFFSDTLYKHHTIASDLVAFFEARFDPDQDRSTDELRAGIIAALDNVSLLNEDRILRRFVEVMEATQRTNYFRSEDGQPRTFLALKFTPTSISNIPRPVPMFEIFVSSPDFEGVHLRGGPIARGGLRWSDRLEDYRTEVLGLVKAQVVKNAVIVPTGAKGGFVIKGSREGVSCYRDFIRGLLDTTDNIVDGEVVTPPGVRAYDGEDPYLVVAADKGTATFSDEANRVAGEYDFWLGDAFASGGSNGYDHKKMGITARGAWVSVQRHFAERDIDVQTESVTVLGIGDMAGDVFGNGMLSSRCLKLVAAFNHLHIFIDPDPDPELSFAERERLFKLPRSSWQDYNADLISKGGGIFKRSDKSIAISKEMKALFAIEESDLSPDDLINRLLKSPVQLIWNGGIGTYIKASTESHDDVGDRANDQLRVDARELRCAVIGEGGNLGLTQRARIEFGLNGGAVNTDFIDNSAGVDCSDHEVNIKIALNTAVISGRLDSDARNALLEDMTDEVASLVLHNNYLQAQTLSLAERHASTRESEYQRAIGFLGQHAGLDRELEYLPADDVLVERFAAGKGLSRPELAVLLAYAKSFIKNALIESDIHTDPLIGEELLTPFPRQLVETHQQSLTEHRLAPQIIATQLANEVVDHMGISFVPHMLEFVGGTVDEVVRAYAVVANCYDIQNWFNEVRDLQAVNAQLKLAMLLELMRLGRRATRWLLRHRSGHQSVQQLVDELKPDLTRMIGERSQATRNQGHNWQQRYSALMEEKVPEELAKRSANASELARLLPIIDVAQRRECDPVGLYETVTMIGHEFHLDWLASQIAGLECHSLWQSIERDALLDDLTSHQSRIGARVMVDAAGDLVRWQVVNEQFDRTWRKAMDEARHTSIPDFSMYAMLIRKLGDLLGPPVNFRNG